MGSGITGIADRLCLAFRLTGLVGFFLNMGSGAVRLPVIYFHDVIDEHRQSFRELLSALTGSYRFIRLDELDEVGANDAGKPPAMLMFDDALVRLIDNALPALEEYNCPATVFAPTAWVGKKAGWTERALRLGWEVMSWETIAKLDSPMLRFEGHTVSHPHLCELSTEQIRTEFTDSKKTLEEKLGRTVQYLCYPFGEYDRRCMQAARECGYRGAFSSIHSVWQPRKAPFEMRRLLCDADSSVDNARRIMSGQAEWRGLYQLLRSRVKSSSKGSY